MSFASGLSSAMAASVGPGQQEVYRGRSRIPQKKAQAFANYVEMRRRELERQNPEVVLDDLLPKAMEEWKLIPEEQKERYGNKAVDVDTGLLGLQPSKRRGTRGHPFAKKALTPYLCFIKEQKHLVVGQQQQQQREEGTQLEFMKEAARRWNELTEEEREPYRKMAEVDKVRYDRETQNYNYGGVGPNDHKLYQQQYNLAQQASKHQPQILVSFPTSCPSTEQGALSEREQLTQQLQQVEQQLQQLEKRKFTAPKTALHYFDQEKRVEVLKMARPQNAEEAIEAIRREYDRLPLAERHRYENLALQDSIRFQKEEQEAKACRDQLHQRKSQIEEQLQEAALETLDVDKHPKYVHLQQAVQNQQALLVRQAMVIQKMMKLLHENGIEFVVEDHQEMKEHPPLPPQQEQMTTIDHTLSNGNESDYGEEEYGQEQQMGVANDNNVQ